MNVQHRFQFRRYRIPFRAPVRTSQGIWAEREGVIVRLESDSGKVGWGEAAPVPHFGGEPVDRLAHACSMLGDRLNASILAELATHAPTLAGALRLAIAEIDAPNGGGAGFDGDFLPVAALLPAGRQALAAIAAKAEIGFRTFKWKVGVGDDGDERSLLDDVCAALPGGAKLRLDANGAWDRRQSERWLERCADRPVEFIEQPVGPAARGADDLLLGLAADYPTPIALDESLVRDGDVGRWLGAGWPGVFIVKPVLFADCVRALEQLAAANAHVVFSSALETGVGARAALRLAFAWPGERRAAGFGVWPLFGRPEFDGPAAGPVLRRADVENIRPMAVWENLSP